MTIKKEFIHSTYCRNKENFDSDALIVKEVLHHPDGSKKRNLKIVENYQRPFWVLKPEHRLYKDKREYEFIERLDKYYSNQAQLPKNVYRRLEDKPPFGYIRMSDMTESPYLYGTDVSPNVLLRDEYINTYGMIQTEASVAVLDYEWT